jgi:hypothetical protein
MSAYDPKRTWVARVSFRVAQQNAILLVGLLGGRASEAELCGKYRG